MSKIYVEINQKVNFNINLYDTEISNIFFQQHLDLRESEPDRASAQIVDGSKYTINYFVDLINKANFQGILDWTRYHIRFGPEHYADNQKQFNDMHKDLEIIAGIQKYGNLGQEDKKLIDEMHCCLHFLESDSAPLNYEFKGRNWILFNYYANVTKNLMPEPVKFSRSIRPGQVCLDYPYVGKEPLVCALHKDNSILQQTCKMIDRISVSWKLFTGNFVCNQFLPVFISDIDKLLTTWYHENKHDMDALGYTLDKIINHTGFCIIGEIDDHSVFGYLNTTPNIEVTDYRLIS